MDDELGWYCSDGSLKGPATPKEYPLVMEDFRKLFLGFFVNPIIVPQMKLSPHYSALHLQMKRLRESVCGLHKIRQLTSLFKK